MIARSFSRRGDGAAAHITAHTPAVRDERIVVLALAVLVVHILVDAFVTLEPGVTRAAHLLPAALPIAVIAGVGLGYRRARAGLRASLALMFGCWALVGAGIAVASARPNGPRGDDWTGFLLAPAGLALLAVGVGLLWRARQQTGRRYLRRALRLVGAILAAYYVVWPVGFAIVATHKPRTPVVIGDLGRPAAAVSIRTRDGLTLAGSYVASQNGAAVILFPRQFQPVGHARLLARHGYGVLMIDMRGQGASEGDPNAWGWGSAQDLDAAVAWLEARPDVERGRIGGLGLSVGGEQLIEAAAANPGLRALAVEGTGWRSARDGWYRYGIPRPQVWLQIGQDWMLTLATAVLSGDAPPRSLVQFAPQIAPRPILWMVGEYDNTMERVLTPAYYAAAGEPKTLWQIPNAGHTAGLAAQPQAYEQRVISFFDRALGGAE